MRFFFEATITEVDDPLEDYFSVGDTISGYYTFDSETPNEYPGGSTGSYLDAVTDLLFIVGNNAFTGISNQGSISVLNKSGAIGYIDAYFVEGDFSGPNVGVYAPVDFGMSLYNFDGDIFSSVALPLVPPDLSSCEDRVVDICFQEPGGNWASVRGEVTSLVSEPAT